MDDTQREDDLPEDEATSGATAADESEAGASEPGATEPATYEAEPEAPPDEPGIARPGAGAAAEPEPQAPPPPPPGTGQAEGPRPKAYAYGTPAPVEKRVLAFLIDFVITLVVGVVPVLGGLAAAAYWLIRDGLETEFMDQRSIGKKVMKLRAVRLDGTRTDITDSIRRNWVFALIGIVYFLTFSIVGIIFAIPLALLTMILVGLEAILVFADDEGRRFGDKVANTVVIEVDS